MNWQQISESLRKRKEIKCKLYGNSMTPRIKSGQLVTITPNIEHVKIGDIVFCKVNGNYCVHAVKAIDGKRYQIANNHGHINGWTKNIFGKVIKIED